MEEGLQRATDRDNLLPDASTADRFEKESLDFHNKVRRGYLDILKNEPERFRLIDAARGIDAIHQDVRQYIDEFIELCN